MATAYVTTQATTTKAIANAKVTVGSENRLSGTVANASCANMKDNAMEPNKFRSAGRPKKLDDPPRFWVKAIPLCLRKPTILEVSIAKVCGIVLWMFMRVEDKPFSASVKGIVSCLRKDAVLKRFMLNVWARLLIKDHEGLGLDENVKVDSIEFCLVKTNAFKVATEKDSVMLEGCRNEATLAEMKLKATVTLAQTFLAKLRELANWNALVMDLYCAKLHVLEVAMAKVLVMPP